MKILITGADGFIAKNLMVRLGEIEGFETVGFSRQTDESALTDLVKDIDAVIHLAGINRPQNPEEFVTGNAELTRHLCRHLLALSKPVPVIFSSSTQAALDNPYGNSKRQAEEVLHEYGQQSGAAIHVYRLPNVFGKWCKPNYNSAVATFCHNIARNLPIQINDPSSPLTLVYVDDVIEEFIRILQQKPAASEQFCVVPVQYQTTVGELAGQIQAFRDSRQSLISETVGRGLVRALYSTYMSYLPPEAFAYGVPKYGDQRGVFVEMLKTQDSGQFSFFTAHPGITRGGHYHHSKTEKFLVIKGSARFNFRHVVSGETYQIFTQGDEPQIVETIPGWGHDITNVGDDEMVVMLWANEIFDRERPDTIACKV